MDTIEPDGSHEYHRDLMWLAFKQQYFASVFVSRTPFNANMEFSTTAQEGRDYMKDFAATVAFPFDKNVDEYNFAFYYGPNDYRILKHVEFGGETIDLERMIPLGGWLVGWINRLVTIPIFGWLKDYLPSFGLIILILTLLVKAVIFPLTYKSYLSTAKMRVIRPEMEALNAKYPRKEDAMKKQQAMMELYRKAGINPMGGCLPLLIQMESGPKGARPVDWRGFDSCRQALWQAIAALPARERARAGVLGKVSRWFARAPADAGSRQAWREARRQYLALTDDVRNPHLPVSGAR